MNRIPILTILLLQVLFVSAQSLPVPRNIQAAYKKGTRSADGRPGKNYWQNSAQYRLDIQFDPATRLVAGTVDIAYSNNSPDTLRQLWFKLYPNLYKKGTPRISRIAPEDISDGVVIDSFWLDGKQMDYSRLNIEGTNMVVNRTQISPGKNTGIRISYHYTLNRGSHVRTGQVDSGAHFIAYFFPRVAVYDDIDGWNKFPYNGMQEFYNDFCDFETSITVPANYVVWATGDLQNCNEVLQGKFCKRIRAAETGDQLVNVIDSTDISSTITMQKPWNTWKFSAKHVTDFAFATSNHYIWQSSSVMVDPASGRRTRVDAAFNPQHRDYFWVAPDARKTVEAMSYVFPKWPFPYSHITVFDGLDQMEYPMMVNDNPVETRFESITLTDHEIFHTMFPFYMGTNETKYAWMDEGWATIGEWLISPLIDSTIVDDYGVLPVEKHLGNENDLPVITLSTESSTAYFTNSYPEPAMGYLFVKDLLGDSLFTRALHHYIRQWNGKHPIPFDFFNCMNEGSGKNLNWFWKKWFFEGGTADLAITSVVPKLNGYKITVESKGSKPVPVDLLIHFNDKSSMKVHRSIAVWEKGQRTVVINLPTTRKISRIELGSTWVPDVDKTDNIYSSKDEDTND